MKKLALFLALCLMIQAIGLTAFAEEQVVEIPEAAFAEAAAPEETPAEEPVKEEEPVTQEEPAEEEKTRTATFGDVPFEDEVPF